jgi:hypothetical protein
MSGFDLSDYVDVAERERLLFERYPDARIQVDLEDVRDAAGELIAWKARAQLWRTPDDLIPVVDWAVEPVPGKTPYTKDSEAMNASTSAVGRAIVLAGFTSKKIASADEVRNRQTDGGEAPSQAQKGKLKGLLRELGVAEEREDWPAVAKAFVGEEFGKDSSAKLTKQEMSGLIDYLQGRLEKIDVPFA